MSHGVNAVSGDFPSWEGSNLEYLHFSGGVNVITSKDTEKHHKILLKASLKSRYQSATVLAISVSMHFNLIPPLFISVCFTLSIWIYLYLTLPSPIYLYLFSPASLKYLLSTSIDFDPLLSASTSIYLYLHPPLCTSVYSISTFLRLFFRTAVSMCHVPPLSIST